MARNLELKARCRSIEEGRRIARTIGASHAGVRVQTDTYLQVPSGRLKMRQVRGVRSELIFYDRPTTAVEEGRWSSYVVYPVRDHRGLLSALSNAWPVRVVVHKRRALYLLENTRIHLDDVRGLGSFIEFEVVLSRGRRQAEQMYRRLRGAFGIREADLIGGSYADLLQPLRRTR